MNRPRCRPPCRPVAQPLESRAYLAPLTFGTVTSFPAAPAGMNPADVVTAQLDPGGPVDAIVADEGTTTGAIAVLFGNGTGGFDNTKTMFFDYDTPIQSVAVGDLNGDGYPDIVAVGTTSTGTLAQSVVHVLDYDGNGTFTAGPSLQVGLRPEGVALANLTGNPADADALDIITANQGQAADGSVSVLMNNGTGTFAPAVPYDGGSNPDALAVGDLNGDGYPDIVTVDPENDEVHVLLNLGAAVAKDNTPEAGTFPATVTTYTTDTTGRAVTIADTNNDGRPDIVVANLRSADVGVLLNSGQGLFAGQVTYKTGAFPFSVLSADLNGDGRPDLITADSRDNAIGVLVHNAQGAYNNGGTDATPKQFSTGPNSAPEAVAVADLVTGDPRPDLVVADFNTGEIGVLLNTTAPAQFAEPPTSTTLAASQGTVQLDNAVTLTAQVTPDPSTAYPAGRVVVFFAGDRVLGVGKLTTAGTATITTTSVGMGATFNTAGMASVALTAEYSGNTHYRGSVGDLEETVETVGVATPLLSATAVVVTGRAGRVGRGTSTVARATPVAASDETASPAAATPPLAAATAVVVTGKLGQPSTPFVPGDAGTVAVTITDQGTAAVSGTVAVSLSIAPAGNLATAVPLEVVGNPKVGLALAGGGNVVVSVPFTVPTTLTPGGYTIVATLTAAGTLPAGQVSAATAATAAVVPVALVLVPFTPGDAGTVGVTISNEGAGTATNAVVAVSLLISPAGEPTAAVPLAVVGSATFAVNLRGGTSRVVPVRFTVPANLAAGSYTIYAALAPARTVTAAEVSAVPAATAQPTLVTLDFGHVPSGRQAALTTTLPGGPTVTLSITGPGTGNVVETADGTSVSVVGTTAASTVSITSAGDAPFTINTFTDNYRLGALSAPDMTLAGIPADALVGSLTLSTGVDRVTLAGVTDGGITIGPDGHAALSLGTVTDTALSAPNSSLASLTVNSWSDTTSDAIITRGILGGLTSAGDFGPRLSLTGVATPLALGSASIGGTLDSPVWSIGTNVGTVKVGGVAAGFSGDIGGSVASLTDAGDLAGVLAAKSFGDVVIGGSLLDADILAGATLGLNGQLGGGDDTFNAGRIASVQVGGNVTGSLVAAGFKPASDAPFTPVGGTLIPGGSIGALTVDGTTDATSRFAAASLPTIG